jgi:hypothetical protein
VWTQAARAYNSTVDRGRRTGPRSSIDEQSPQERAYNRSPTEIGDYETRSWDSTAGAGVPRHGCTGTSGEIARNTAAVPQHNKFTGRPQPRSTRAQRPRIRFPRCRPTQPSGRPCSPCSTAQRDTRRDQEGEPRQARTGSTGTPPPQHIQTAWGKAGSTRYKTYHVRPFAHDIKLYGKRRQHSRAEGVP